MMSIEQTSQLLQLILNSVLLAAVCAVVMGCVLFREHWVRSQFLEANHHYINAVVSLSRDRQRPYRKQLHDLRRWQRYEHHNLSFSYGALLSALLSCLLLAGRSLMQWNGLIVGALALFGVGVLCLLCVVWRWLWWSLHHPSAAWVPVQDKRSSSLRRVPRVRRAIAPSRSTLQLVGRSPRS